MGQPPFVMPYAGLAAGAYRPDDSSDIEPTGSLTLGLFKNISSPITSIGVAGEGYVGARGAEIDGGVRGLIALRPLRIALGIDYNIRDNAPDLILTFLHPLRRGGLFGLGGRLRIDWLPTRGQTFQLGLSFPLWQPWMGRTRPRTDHVALSVPKQPPLRFASTDAALDEVLANVEHAADWINRFTTPFFDPAGGSREDSLERFADRVERFKAHMAERDALHPKGHLYPEEIRVYHAELERAFTLAVSNGATGRRPGETTAQGREIAARARGILLDELIFPYNLLLGRIKKPDTTRGFAGNAHDRLMVWLQARSGIPAERNDAILHVFQTLLDAIETNRAGSARYWETSQLVWIPLQLGLRPEEHDSQAELDALLERAVGERFTGGNEHHYVINEKFQWELLRQIGEAEDYHVLWIHDFRGVNSARNPDQLGYAQVFYGYLDALIDGVRRYDATGKLPTFMIFLDQNFYEPNRGRIWMTLLQDPLRARVRLPGGDEGREMEEAVAKRQEELRAAVAASKLLQERARRFGDDWLHNRVKVHVNITNPVDWSYWSPQVIPLLGIPDVLMRDHRKIAFYDVTETDPSKGEAIFTGMGIGEHYAGPTWEDRAILVTGPSLVGLKASARQLLLNQGFAPDAIPYPLRPQPKPDDYGELVAERERQGFDFRAMQIHNQTGYAPKPINTAKATLYNIMPSGSILVVPDSLWNSPFWAGMLAGNALRGGHVYVISPALDNAPSAGFPQMSRAQEIFTQTILVQQKLGDEMAATGGSLRTGIYATDVDVGDLANRTARYYDGVVSSPMFTDIWDVDLSDPSLRAALEKRYAGRKQRALAKLEELGFEPGYVTEDIDVRKPKLHLKAQILMNGEALEVFKQVDWAPMIDEYMVQRARQVHDNTEYADVRQEWDAMSGLWDQQAERVVRGLAPEQIEKAAGFLTVGSHNMDYRGMMMDGEVL
jgi:hypothetical protein